MQKTGKFKNSHLPAHTSASRLDHATQLRFHKYPIDILLGQNPSSIYLSYCTARTSQKIPSHIDYC